MSNHFSNGHFLKPKQTMSKVTAELTMISTNCNTARDAIKVSTRIADEAPFSNLDSEICIATVDQDTGRQVPLHQLEGIS